MSKDYLTSVGLTLTNPSTILSFIAAFGALSLATGPTAPAGWSPAPSVPVCSAVWWLRLCSAISIARRALTPHAITWIDRLSAAVLILFGAAAATDHL